MRPGIERPGENPAKFQTGRILAISVCHFIHDVYSSFLAPLLPLLIKKLSLSLTQAGSLSMLMQIPALFNPFIGKLADRTSVRLFIILAPVTTAVPMSLIGVAPGYGVLVILLVLAGTSTACFHVPAPVMVNRLAGNQIGKGMSFFMTGGEFARTVGPMIAVGAVALFGFEGFYPIMIVGVAASFWMYLKVRHILIDQNVGKQIPLRQTWREMRAVLIPLTAILIVRGFMQASMSTFLPTLINQETGDLWQAGLGLTVFEAAGVVGIIIMGPLSDRLGRRMVLLISLVGAPLSMILFMMAGGWLRYFALTAAGFTLLSTMPVMLAIVQENAHSSPSAANGMFMMVSYVARSSIVTLVGFIADHTGLRATYYIGAVIAFCAIPFIVMIPKKEPPE